MFRISEHTQKPEVSDVEDKIQMAEEEQISKILRFIQQKPESLADKIDEEEVVVVCICPADATVLNKYMKEHRDLKGAVRINSSPEKLKDDFVNVAGPKLLETSPEPNQGIFLIYYPLNARDRIYNINLRPR